MPSRFLEAWGHTCVIKVIKRSSIRHSKVKSTRQKCSPCISSMKNSCSTSSTPFPIPTLPLPTMLCMCCCTSCGGTPAPYEVFMYLMMVAISCSQSQSRRNRDGIKRPSRGHEEASRGSTHSYNDTQSALQSQVIRAHQRHALVQRDEVVPKLSFTPRAQRHSRAAPRTQSQSQRPLRFDRGRLRDA